MLPIDRYTVATLKTLASDLNVKVSSKMLKAELYSLLADHMTALHIEAKNIDAARTVRKARNDFNSERKSYSERMISRCKAYASQNGYTIGTDEDIYPERHFTAKQRKRHAKKYNAQYAKLSRKISV